MAVFHIDAIAAREIAEWASSIRGTDGHPVYFVAAPREGGGVSFTATPDHSPCSDDHDAVVPCSTKTVQSLRHKVTAIHIRAEGMDHDEPLDQYDAVFWTEAAVEKFLFPYYASKMGWEAASWLRTMARAFYGYVPGEDPPPGPFSAYQISADQIPFAMAHIPRSDYVEITDLPHPPGSDIALLFKEKDGGVKHCRLAEFL